MYSPKRQAGSPDRLNSVLFLSEARPLSHLDDDLASCASGFEEGLRSARRRPTQHHTLRSRDGGGDIRPARQLPLIFPGTVEQHREHLRGEFDRDLFHPIESFVTQQAIEA